MVARKLTILSFFLAAAISLCVYQQPAAYAQESDKESENASAVHSKLERTRELLTEAKANPPAPLPAQPPSEGGQVMRMIQALGICVGVLFVVLYLIKKYNPKLAMQGGRKIKILERTSVSSRTSLVLAEVEGAKILFSVGSDRVSLLKSNDAQLEFIEQIGREDGEEVPA